MSDQPNPTEPDAPTTDPETPATDAKSDAPKPTETVDFWKSKAREQEKRAKDNADAARRLAEIEEASKTEAQKAADRLATAEKSAADATAALARLEVALDKGLTPSQAKRLVGTTREELEADADELLKDIGDAARPRAPKPDPTQGRAPSTTPLDPRAADIAQIEADLKAASRR
jgi:hypothetical protein